MRRACFKKLEASKQNTIECHSAEKSRVLNAIAFQKTCTVSISKDQSLKVCQVFLCGSEQFADSVAFAAVKREISKLKLIPDTIFFLDA